MYCLLGNITLEPIDITDFSEIQTATFAEHAVLKGKPRLQSTGEGLTELSFAARLHFKIGNVESRWQSLVTAKSAQKALALVWGRTGMKGYFVITNLSSTTLFTDEYGNVLCREISIQLKEYVGEIEQGLLGAALQTGNNSILGAMLPQELSSTLSAIKSAVTKGVQLYRTGTRAVDEVRNTFALIRQLKTDPTLALSYLPKALDGLGGALGAFGELVGMQATFNSAQAVLEELGQFGREAKNIYQSLAFVQQDLAQASNGTNWFESADRTFSETVEQIDNLAPVVATMTAWVVLRSDEEVQDDADRT